MRYSGNEMQTLTLPCILEMQEPSIKLIMFCGLSCESEGTSMSEDVSIQPSENTSAGDGIQPQVPAATSLSKDVPVKTPESVSEDVPANSPEETSTNEVVH